MKMKKDNSIRPFFCLDTKVVHVPRRDATADEKAARDRHFYVRLSVHCNVDTSDGHLHTILCNIETF